MGRPVGMYPPPSDRAPAPPTRRWRLVTKGSRLKPCPLRHEADDHGVMRLVACTDIKGTLSSCKGCQR